MKLKFAALALALSVCVSAQAEEKPTPEQSCAETYELAEVVMKARQVGVKLPDMMEAVADDQMALFLIREAYAQPRFNVEENQTKEIQRFAEQYYLVCLKVARGE